MENHIKNQIKNYKNFINENIDITLPEIYSILLKKQIISADACDLEDDRIDVYGLNKHFPYFLDNQITIELDGDSDIQLNYVRYEEDIDYTEAVEVNDYLCPLIESLFDLAVFTNL